MQFTLRQSRFAALAVAGALASSTFLSAAPAKADSSKTWKTGALALGALGAYMLSKGKTVEGAAAVAGGYYAYKKGRDEQRDDRNDDWLSGFPGGGYGDGGYYGNGNGNDGYYSNGGGYYGNGGGYYGGNDGYYGNGRRDDRYSRGDRGRRDRDRDGYRGGRYDR